MKIDKPSAAQIWKQLEDDLIPRLRLSTTDRAVYSHLLRHTRLEGKSQLHFSIAWLSRGTRLSGAARESVRRLVDKGALRLLERSRSGHLVEVLLPHQIRSASPQPAPGSSAVPPDIEDLDFLKSAALRKYLHARERGICFYCLCRLSPRTRCLDHVVPRVRRGLNSYRNLVSACVECNSAKGERAAGDFLRALHRERSLTSAELSARLQALESLRKGKLCPTLPPTATLFRGKRRPPLHPFNP
jgi:hypothetical protein